MHFSSSRSCVDLLLPCPFLRHGHRILPTFLPPSTSPSPSSVSCARGLQRRAPTAGNARRRKENVWSVDNDLAASAPAKEKSSSRSGKRRPGERGSRPPARRRGGRNARVLVSGALLMEVETVLQTQEPVIRPSWDAFANSVSGIWKGVAAVFSPATAEMEPIGVGEKNESLFDCFTLSRIDKSANTGTLSKLKRNICGLALNPFGEMKKLVQKNQRELSPAVGGGPGNLPAYESFDLVNSQVLEEDEMDMESGLIFFEDGSYSKGPADLQVGESHESKYFLSPTFKFEQCLVKGCHKRLRVVHTIEFSEGGANIQIVRVAVYEEHWGCNF